MVPSEPFSLLRQGLNIRADCADGDHVPGTFMPSPLNPATDPQSYQCTHSAPHFRHECPSWCSLHSPPTCASCVLFPIGKPWRSFSSSSKGLPAFPTLPAKTLVVGICSVCPWPCLPALFSCLGLTSLCFSLLHSSHLCVEIMGSVFPRTLKASESHTARDNSFYPSLGNA